MTPTEERERRNDSAYWAKLHVRSDRSPAVDLSDRLRRRMRGAGVRRTQGGEKVVE